MVTYLVIIVAIAFLFDFSNGFHDSANSIATIVGTRVMKPLPAVVMAAFFNFLAAFWVGTAVANTIGKGMVRIEVVDANVVLGALLGAIGWNLITWSVGLPSSSSHALIGGYGGAAVAKAGFGAIIPSGWTWTLAFIVLSPLIGLALGFGLMVLIYWTFRRVAPGRVDRIFRVLQVGSAAFFSFAHGANDAQKTMGIIVGLLLAYQGAFAGETGLLGHLHVTNSAIPDWVIIGAYSAIAFGTLFGGWRIVHTMGSRITRLRPVGGFAAEIGGAVSILVATFLAIPVSTTHAKTGAIVGVGAANRISAVRWGVASRIVWAWVLTIPASAGMAALFWFLLSRFIHLAPL